MLGQQQDRAKSRTNGVEVQRSGFDGNGQGRAFDRWSAHVRYFLARYPLETRDSVAQRLAAYGIRSLLSSHRQEDLTLDALFAATDAADKEVLSSMRQHARGRQERRGGRAATAGRTNLRQRPDGAGASPARREVLRERRLTHNVDAGTTGPLATEPPPAAMSAPPAGLRKRRHKVAGRPDVLTRYPFVDDLADTQGGGVGAAMHQAMPRTPIQYLAKREIRRLAHEAFRELKASALGIRVSDLPCAIQFLFFGDSASLLAAKGDGGGGGGDGGGTRPARRSAKDVHLVMALARECLPPTLAHAARDTSTLSSASTYGGMDAGWLRGGENMFVSERRWIKTVAHIIRRLWDMDGTPEKIAARNPRRRPTTSFPSAAPAITTAPFGAEFQQPAWRPPGGGAAGVGRGGVPAGGGGRFAGDGGDDGEAFDSGFDAESFLEGPATVDSRSDTTSGWGSSSMASRATGGVGEEEALRAWEEEGEAWVGAGRSLARAPPSGDEEGRGRNLRDGGTGRLFEAATRGSPRAAASSPRRRTTMRHEGSGGGGRAGGGGDWKEGTRPAGMWEVKPPAHVAARRRARRQGGSGRDRGDGGRTGGGPAYLRSVQSRIGPQVDAHKDRLRKIGRARRSAVRDVVARRRLDHLDSDASRGFPTEGGGGGGGILRNSSGSNLGSQDRGHSPGEHALDIAGAFLESSLMSRLAGGDWFASDDGEPASAEFASAWEAEGAVKVPSSGRRHYPLGGRSKREDPRRGGGQAERTRRQAHTGWLGDFGPVHTHTVRELADDHEDEEEEEGEEGEEGARRREREGGVAGREDRSGGGGGSGSRAEETEGRSGHTRRRGVVEGDLEEGEAGGGGSGEGGGSVEESTAAIASAAASAAVLSDLPAALATDSDGAGGFSGGQTAGALGNENNNNNVVDDNFGTAGTGDANIVAPLDGGLDAYLQLASHSGALLEGSGDGGGGRGGAGAGPGLGEGSPGGYTGATTGSWWEEDRSALEVGEVPSSLA